MKKQTGFTLAETLMAIIVIGVIAALTIPGVVNSFQRSANSSLIKKTMVTFKNAADMITTEEGKGQFSLTSVFTDEASGIDNFMRLYLKATSGGTFSNTYAKIVNLNESSSFSCDVPYRLPGPASACVSRRDLAGVGRFLIIDIDANGITNPNIIGRDLFRFYINEVGKTITKSPNSSSPDDGLQNSCEAGNADACTAYLENNAWIMDY